MKLCQFRPHDLAVAPMFWRAHFIVVVLVTTSVTTIGQFVWDTLPTAKILLQMLITSNWEFPPVASSLSVEQEIINEDERYRRREVAVMQELQQTMQASDDPIAQLAIAVCIVDDFQY